MNILIHTRIADLFASIRANLEAQQHQVDGAFSLGDGRRKMIDGAYDKVFIGNGVSNFDRLELMILAGELGLNMAEIIDAGTVAQAISRHSSTGRHPCLTHEVSTTL